MVWSLTAWGGELAALNGRVHYATRPCLMGEEERSRAFWSTTGIIRLRMDLVGKGRGMALRMWIYFADVGYFPLALEPARYLPIDLQD